MRGLRKPKRKLSAESLLDIAGEGCTLAHEGSFDPGAYLRQPALQLAQNDRAGATLILQDSNESSGSSKSLNNLAVSTFHLAAAEGCGIDICVEHAADGAAEGCSVSDADLSSVHVDKTGVALWPSSFALCGWLRRHAARLRAARVLELGAGIGLAGLGTGTCWGPAAHVVLTDGGDDALALLERNVARNSDAIEAAGASIIVRKLRWGRPLSEVEGLQDGSYDVVLGADLVYREMSDADSETLFRTVTAALKPDGVFVLSHCVRGMACEGPGFAGHMVLLRAARAAGLRVDIVERAAGEVAELQPRCLELALLMFKRADTPDEASAAAADAANVLEEMGSSFNRTLNGPLAPKRLKTTL